MPRRSRAKNRIDTRAVGLDTGLALSRWLTGTEHLHYGLWTGLEPVAANVGAAQEAYSARLFAHLPDRPGLRILDIGGGAGETAKALIGMGHEVEIVVPSAFLASRCRANAPGAVVHECRFEALQSAGQSAGQSMGNFDLCLFSESFQYIPLAVALDKAASLLVPDGEILIGDCFRADTMPKSAKRIPGGGHRVGAFRTAVAARPLRIIAEEDVTDAVAPSITVEQGLFNVLGVGLTSLDRELTQKRPLSRRILVRLAGAILGRDRRDRLVERLTCTARSAEVFRANNRYLLLRLGKTSQAGSNPPSA